MNILYLCDEYPPGRHGGIGTAVQLLAREMVKRGNTVVVAGFYDWGYGGEDEFEDEGIKVYRFRRILSSKIFNTQDALLTRALYKLLKITGVFHQDIKKSLSDYGIFLERIIDQYNIDIIEMPDYNDYMRFCKSYVAFPKFTVPVIVKMHGGMTYIARENNHDVPAYIWQMENELLKQSNAVCSVSKYNADKTSQYLQYNGLVTVLYNGINTNITSQDIKKITGRVIFSGSLDRNKGVYQLMKAWDLVYEQMPDARLLLFGKGPVRKISKLLSRNAFNSVCFKDHVPRVQLLGELTRSTVAVFPSFAESFGLAPIEAMMSGTATIFTATTSGPEIINDGEDGLLVNPRNEKEIADKILFLLNNPQIASNFAKNGREKVKKYFDITITAKKEEEYYYTIK